MTIEDDFLLAYKRHRDSVDDFVRALALGGDALKHARKSMTAASEAKDAAWSAVVAAGGPRVEVERMRRLEETADHFSKLFEIQRRRMAVATARWQKATGHANVLPDLGQLLEWLLGELDRLSAAPHCPVDGASCTTGPVCCRVIEKRKAVPE